MKMLVAAALGAALLALPSQAQTPGAGGTAQPSMSGGNNMGGGVGGQQQGGGMSGDSSTLGGGTTSNRPVVGGGNTGAQTPGSSGPNPRPVVPNPGSASAPPR